MKSDKKSIVKGIVISGMVLGSVPLMANSSDLYKYEVMGSGSELRTELLAQYGSPIDVQNYAEEDYVLGENKCGEEGKKEETKEAKKESKKGAEKEKTSEAKCGENTCGGETKKESKKEAKKGTEKGKAAEAKCGENACGGGK